MSRMQHRVLLTPAERTQLGHLLQRGAATAQAQRRARILLHADRADAHRSALSDVEVAAAVAVSARTVARVRAAWVVQGLACLHRPPAPKPHKLSPEAEVRLVALACSTPPPGYAVWSLRLLAGRAVELEIADTLSHETVRRTLKKTVSSPGRSPGL